MTTQPPPGTGGTLVEELEQAAKRLKCAEYTMCFGCPGCALSDRLAARAARVRELGIQFEPRKGDDNPFDRLRWEMYLALTGPLSPTEPAAKENER